MSRHLRRLGAVLSLVLISFLVAPAMAGAQVTTPNITTTTVGNGNAPEASINLDLGDTRPGEAPSQSVTIILLLTVLSIAPALLIMLTSFTRVVVVLSLTRNAIGLQSIPPNQVIIGLSLFLSLFLMAPTLKQVNEDGLQPFLKGTKSQSVAFQDGAKPLRTFMLGQVRKEELSLFVRASSDTRPDTPDDVPLAALIPAYILSELKTAFIIGFVVFVPFLVIDLVVSSSLMSMGMMMLPPVLISLPFKLLLFVMVDGWALVVRALITSFR